MERYNLHSSSRNFCYNEDQPASAVRDLETAVQSGQGREVAAMNLILRKSNSRHLAWVGDQTLVLDEQIQERPKSSRDEDENLGTE